MKPGMVPPPLGEESQIVVLPPGWQSYLSPQGRRYYVNTATNETTWERPGSSPGIPASPGPHRSSLPPTVNGYHVAGTPAHPPETAHMSVRKSTGDSQVRGHVTGGRGHQGGAVKTAPHGGPGDHSPGVPQVESGWYIWVVPVCRDWERVGDCGLLVFSRS